MEVIQDLEVYYLSPETVNICLWWVARGTSNLVTPD